VEVSTTSLTALLIGVIGIILLPLGGVWALNTLFSLNLEYTLVNWTAVLFVQLYVQVVLKAAVMSGSSPKK
jgi:hypothetical protein